MIDPFALQMLLMVLIGWLDHREREALAYLIEENRLLRRQLGGRRLRLTDNDRRRLAVHAFRVGRRALREIAKIVTPDTLMRSRPGGRCDVGSSTSRTSESRADAVRAPLPAGGHGALSASRAIGATSTPTAHDRRTSSKGVGGESDSRPPADAEGRGSPDAGPRVNEPTTEGSGPTKRRRTR